MSREGDLVAYDPVEPAAFGCMCDAATALEAVERLALAHRIRDVAPCSIDEQRLAFAVLAELGNDLLDPLDVALPTDDLGGRRNGDAVV
jgi:hypothetical protein